MNSKSLDILKKYYGYTSFRKGQEDIINSIINKNDVLAIMPTGGGKSICYQIPYMVLEGITIVISPLISLMKDQVDTLKTMGINATYINSSLGHQEFNEILDNIRDDKYKIIYVAPERLDSYEFINIILSYTKIHYFIENFINRPVVTAFTATASKEVREDIKSSLRLKSPDIYTRV